MNKFQFQVSGTNIIFGAGAAAKLGAQAAALGVRRAFLVADPFVAQQPAGAAAQASLRAAGVEPLLYTDVVPDPDAPSVARAAAAYRAAGADGLVALGGGSAMDTAKALGVLATAGVEHIAPFYFGGSATPRGIPPLICLPTTAGTGAEVTFVAIVTEPETGRKMLVRHPSMAPAVALVDPLLSASMPPALTAATGMDALAHALEAITSTMASPLSDALALDAIPRIVESLPCAVADGADAEARAQMAYAATAAGLAFLSGRVHLGHAVGHAIGGAFHMPHGLACIVCMPAILGLLAEACAAELARIAPALGAPDAAGVPGALEALMRRCGVPRLRAALGAHRPSIDDLVGLVQGEERLIRLSRHAPTAAEWAQVFERSM
jgi:alcohol dehydrogenase class IV